MAKAGMIKDDKDTNDNYDKDTNDNYDKEMNDKGWQRHEW